MNKKISTSTKILEYIKEHKQARPTDLSESIGVSLQMVHRSLRVLMEQNQVIKNGSAPRVFYSINQDVGVIAGLDVHISSKYQGLIEDNFYTILPDGKEEYGVQAFLHWCQKRGYNPEQKAKEYYGSMMLFEKSEKEKYAIDVTKKIRNTFVNESYLDQLWYLYPYSIAVFGKTKISQLIYHAKQTQDIALMKRVFSMIDIHIRGFIDYIKPDAIAFIPPTVPRKKQIMTELKKFIHSDLPEIRVEKLKSGILVQQKSLKDLGDRVYNAQHTMIVTTRVNKRYKKLLIIDDFTGSGSTLNQVAKKCKDQGLADVVIGLTLTGSINGFDVLREV